MKNFILLFILLLSHCLYGQQIPADFSQSVIKEENPPIGEVGAVMTCGIYSFNPHVTVDGYLCIDFYARRFDTNWPNNATMNMVGGNVYMYTNTIGGFSVSLIMKDGSYFRDKFETAIFEIDPVFNDAPPLYCPFLLSEVVDVSTSTTQLGFSYVPNEASFQMGQTTPKNIEIAANTPYRLGQLKMKIKSSVGTGVNSAFKLLASGSAVYQYTTNPNEKAIAVNYPVVGWLEGESGNIDIPLVPEAESTDPANPVFAGWTSPVCPGTSGTYTIGAADRATGYDWWIATSDGGSDISNTNIAEVTPANDGLSVSVAWKEAAAGKNYFVCVQAKNDAGKKSAVVSYPVTVSDVPTVELLATSGGTAVTAGGALCGKSPVKLAVKTPQNGVTYTWAGGELGSGVTGNSKDITLTNPTAPKKQTYTVVAENADHCTATADFALTVNPTPDGLVFNPDLESTYPNGQLISGLGVQASVGGPLTTWNWKIDYANGTPAITANTETVDFSVQGNVSVSVTAANAYTCSATKTHNITANGGMTLAMSTLFDGALLCNGGIVPVQITVTGLSEGTTYQYDWYAGKSATGTPLKTVTSSSAENVYAASSAGFYTVKVTAGGLSATQTLEVKAATENATPVIVEPEIIAATPDKKVILLAKANGIGTFNYKWQPENQITDGQANTQYPLTKAIAATTDFQVYMENAKHCVSTGTTKVRLPEASEPDLLLTVVPGSASLCQGNTLQLKAEVQGATGSPSFAWLPADNLSGTNIANPVLTATGLAAGSYTYFVKAKVGNKVMTAPVQMTVSGNTAPTLSKPDPIYCVESVLSLPKVSGLTYKWYITNSQGSTTEQSGNVESMKLSTPDVYTVKVVGVQNDCASDTITFKDMDVRQLELKQTLASATYKLGENVVSTATAENGWEGYTYSWTTPLPKKENTTENTYTVSGASEDSYTFNVSVIDEKGCKATATAVTATKIGGGLELIVDTMHAYCNNGMAMLQAKATGGSPEYQYEWTLAEGDGTVLETAATYLIKDPAANPTAKYQVKVTDNSVPALVRTVTIALADVKNTGMTAPTLTTPGTITILPNSQALLSAHATPAETAACRWNWSPADRLNAPAEATKQYAQTASLDAAQDYQVYMIDNRGCIAPEAALKVDVQNSDNGGFDLYVNALPGMCATTAQTLSTTITPEQNASDLTYEWTSMPDLFGGKSTEEKPEIRPATADSYLIAVTVTNTVTGKKNTAVKTIEVNGNPVPVLALSETETACEGEVLKVNVQPSGEQVKGVYTWYVDNVQQTGVTGNELSLTGLNGTKTIKVTAEGNNGCVADTEEDLNINARPQIEWNPALDVSVNVTETVTATAQAKDGSVASGYNWSWTVTPAGTAVANVYTVTTQPGDTKVDLSVIATDKVTGCKSEALSGKVMVVGEGLILDVVQDGLACMNGSAVMIARNISGDVGPYHFAWTKGTDTEVIGTDSILVVPVTTTATEAYHVVVTNDNGKKGFGQIDIKGVTGKMVPKVVACSDITIPVNTKAVLTANATGTKPFAWAWRPIADLQSPAEAGLQSPVTRELSSETPYRVRVKDASGCISAEDELKVLIDGTKALQVVIVPDLNLCINNHVRYRAVVTDHGTPVGVDASEWKAMRGITPVNGDLLAADYTASKAGTDTIVVVVKKGNVTATAKKVITVQPYEVPALQFDNAISCAGDVLNVSVAGTGQPMTGNYNWFVSKDGAAPVKGSEANGKYTFTDPGNYVVKVVANTQNCTLDTLEKEITIAPIPVIADISIDSVCGVAKVIAITQYADSWEWTDKGVIHGAAEGGIDSIRYFKTTKMVEEFSGTLIAKNTTAGCASAAKEFKNNVYALPTITLNPLTSSSKPESVYPNTPVNIEATFNPSLDYEINWYQDGVVMPDKNSNQITTPALTVKDGQYKFAIEVTNKKNNTCQVSDTAYVAVDDKNFMISFGKDTMDVCQNVTAQFYVKDENNKYEGGLSYNLGSDYAAFNAATTDGHFSCAFATAGMYKVWVEARNTNNDVRKDTIVVRVNPTPTLDIINPVLGETYSLCEARGEIKVDMNVTGTGGWNFYYRLGGVKNTEAVANSPHQLILTGSGEFYIDSLVDSKGCKVTSEEGFVILNDIPRLALKSTDPITKCQGAATDLGITIENAAANDYPVTLFYKEGPGKREFQFADATTKFASTYAGGNYTLDSIRSDRGCIFKLGNKIAVSEFPESNPVLELTDKSDKAVCGEGDVDIPLKVTGGKPNYTLTYYIKGSEDKQLTLNAAGETQLTVSGSGTVVLKAFADANGCGEVAADDSVKILKSDPVVEIDSLDFAAMSGVEFVLGVKEAKAELDYTWQKNNGGFVNSNTSGNKYTDALSNGDARYVLKGSSKTITGCFGTDTVNVYKIPDIPTISIDTNHTRYDLILKFGSAPDDIVDGYRIMHNLWDGYAIETQYSPKVSSTPATSYELATSALDTLEFFYAQAYRSIKTGKGTQTYYSNASDTVGYKKDKLILNSDSKKTNNNLISWLFDMSKNNVKTSADIFNLLYNEVKAVRDWDMSSQKYNATQKNPAYGKVPGAEKYVGIFNISQGEVYQLAVEKETYFIQYGILPKRLQYSLTKSTKTTHNNQLGLWLNKIGMKTTGDVFKEISTENIKAVRIWDFAAQKWVATQKNPAFGKVPGALEFTPLYRVFIGMPLQLPLQDSKTQYLWK